MLVTKYQISAINSYWEKCDEKYLGQTDRGKTVYPPSPSGSRGIIKYSYFLKESQFFKHNCFRVIFFSWHFFVFLFFLEQDLNLTWSVHCSTYSLSIMMNHLSPLARSIKLWIIIHTHTYMYNRSTLNRIGTHTFDTLQHQSLSFIPSGLDHSITSPV